MLTSSITSEISQYYEKRFFMTAYADDPERGEYEWAYSQSKHYKAFIQATQQQNTTGRRYTDKRTKGWKYYRSNARKVRKAYEETHPVPVNKKRRAKTEEQDSLVVTFTRYSPLA